MNVDECKAAREQENRQIYIVCDGPPGPEGGRFVEVNDADGKSIRIGEWLDMEDGYGYWWLCIDDPRALRSELDAKDAEIARLEREVERLLKRDEEGYATNLRFDIHGELGIFHISARSGCGGGLVESCEFIYSDRAALEGRD